MSQGDDTNEFVAYALLIQLEDDIVQFEFRLKFCHRLISTTQLAKQNKSL